MALLFSPDVTLFTDGAQLEATGRERALLREHNVRVVEAPLRRA